MEFLKIVPGIRGVYACICGKVLLKIPRMPEIQQYSAAAPSVCEMVTINKIKLKEILDLAHLCSAIMTLIFVTIYF